MKRRVLKKHMNLTGILNICLFILHCGSDYESARIY